MRYAFYRSFFSSCLLLCPLFFFFFFTATATTEIYTLSLHDALPISEVIVRVEAPDIPLLQWIRARTGGGLYTFFTEPRQEDRKSTRLNSSHPSISYAVFCLKKKKKHK